MNESEAIDAITELLVGQPIWAEVPEAWHCEQDRETHGEWMAEFLADLQRVLHLMRPEMVTAP